MIEVTTGGSTCMAEFILQEFILQVERLYGVEGAGENNKKNSHCVTFPVEMCEGMVQEIQHSILNRSSDRRTGVGPEPAAPEV